MQDIYIRLFSTCKIYTVAMGLWSFYLWFKNRNLDSNYSGAVAIQSLLMLIQTVIAIVLYTQGSASERWVHYLYVVLMAITMPAIFSYTRGRTTYREALIYAVANFFLFLFIDRAIETGNDLTVPSLFQSVVLFSVVRSFKNSDQVVAPM
jgi:hypothetical protein